MIKGGSAALRRNGAARAAFWLEAPLARARQLGAASQLIRVGLSSDSRLSGVGQNPPRALRVARGDGLTATLD
jgi:hypothetical protein